MGTSLNLSSFVTPVTKRLASHPVGRGLCMRSLKVVSWSAALLCCAISYGQPRDGDRPRPEGPRDGERREAPRDGDRRDGDRGPRDGDRREGDRGPRDGDREGFVERMMRLDRNSDGKIEKSELSDERINRLFARADADKDDVVTADELKALESAEREAFGRRGGPGGPPRDGFGPPRGEGGPGPREGFRPPGGMMPSRFGQILPPPVQQMLDLSAEQREQLADLQKDVDARLEKILNERQRDRLREVRERGPGRFGPGGPPEGGPRGDDGPRGPRPEEREGRRPRPDA